MNDNVVTNVTGVLLCLMLFVLVLIGVFAGIPAMVGRTMRFEDYRQYQIQHVTEPVVENGVEIITIHLRRFVEAAE